MIPFRAFITAFLTLTAGPAIALEELASKWPVQETFRKTARSDSFSLPIGPSKDGSTPTMAVHGETEHIAFRVETDAPTLDILTEIQKLLAAEGYAVLFRCHDRACGGFDFRAGLDVPTAPAMYVDLRNYHFIAAERLAGVPDNYAAVLVSRSAAAGYVLMTFATGTAQGVRLKAPAAAESITVSDSIGSLLDASGHAVLDTLEFASGSTDLEPGEYSELAELAQYLADNPASRVLLVGHTDATGSLESNIELSERRAESVLNRLISAHSVDAERISAKGIGFLSPRASNSSAEGRKLNRRVEAVLLAGG